MPEHASWLTLLLAHVKDTLSHNAGAIGDSFVGNHHPTWQSFEPITASLIVAVLVVLVAANVKARLANANEAVIPDDSLTLRTFMEAFLGYFYDLAKSVMDAERAKKYFPIIGTAATFVFFSNIMALIPGLPVATSSLNVTLGCALVVFIYFNMVGIQSNGMGYIKHLMGPKWWLAPLILPIELISLCVRPVTLAVRLMLNMAVDHLILGIFLALVAVFVPLPVMALGIVVVIVQTLVFTLLTSIYIALATEHEEHH
ncbi:MAG: F0F1 ATP synthase subunit A [Myxococcales bacterium]|nr:F0F1 ATP synthase subunit A [Myxococcales bacterium]MCL4752813.1 F0F1 ATP synthase subunit A [Myxococcales bacterium]